MMTLRRRKFTFKFSSIFSIAGYRSCEIAPLGMKTFAGMIDTDIGRKLNDTEGHRAVVIDPKRINDHWNIRRNLSSLRMSS